jgi:hypothetical protein
MSVVLGPADRGVCAGTQNLDTAFVTMQGGDVPLLDAACIAEVGGKETLTSAPGACAWVDAWTRYLREDRRLPDAYVRDHVLVRTWELEGVSRTFTIHYTLDLGWITVPMNDAFDTRPAGATADRKVDEFLAELRAHKLVGSNEGHAWQLKAVGPIVSRARAEQLARTCKGVNGALAAQADVGEDGSVTVRATGVMDKSGHCMAAVVDLERGKAACGLQLCAVF